MEAADLADDCPVEAAAALVLSCAGASGVSPVELRDDEDVTILDIPEGASPATRFLDPQDGVQSAAQCSHTAPAARV